MLTETLKALKSKLYAALNSSDRRAKIQDSDFILGLVQAVAKAPGNFTLFYLHQAANLFFDLEIGRSAFNERLTTSSLVKNLQIALAVLMSLCVSKNEKVSDLLKKIGVSEIIGIDSSMVSLWDGLRNHFKGTFMTSAVKLHMAINLVSGAVKGFSITSGSTHDSIRFPSISSSSLYIFDLGYWSSKLLQKISGSGAFFCLGSKQTQNLLWSTSDMAWEKALLAMTFYLFQFVDVRNPLSN